MKKIILIYLFTLTFSFVCNYSVKSIGTENYPFAFKNSFAVNSHEHCSEPIVKGPAEAQLTENSLILEEKDDINEPGHKIKKKTPIDLNIVSHTILLDAKDVRTCFCVNSPKTPQKIFLLNSVFRI